MTTYRSRWMVAGLVTAAVSAQATFLTVGTYDEQTFQQNVVDSVATAQAGDEALVIEAAEFNAYKASLAASYAAGMGGVINFDENRWGEIAPGLPFAAEYAAGAKTLTITPNAASLELSGNLTAQFAISGGGGTTNQPIGLPGGVIYGGTASTSLTLDIGAITGGLAGEYVNSLGITMLSRTSRLHPGTVAVATFSDLSTATSSSDIEGGAGLDDTFFGFVAPAGEGITNLTITWTGDRVGFDDLAYTTLVPEPASLVLLAVGVAVLAFRRKRG